MPTGAESSDRFGSSSQGAVAGIEVHSGISANLSADARLKRARALYRRIGRVLCSPTAVQLGRY